MNPQLLAVLALLGCAVAMLVVNRPRSDVVALLMMLVLPFTGVVDVREALAGFADPTVVLIALLFVIGEGLVRTGVAQRMGDWLVVHGGANEARLIVMLMVIVATVGSVMSSTGVVALFIPVVMRIAANTGFARERLMMPLAVAALISGMMTLVGTPPNLVLQGELLRNDFEGFGFFDFTPFGVPVLVLAALYMLVARRRLGPRGTAAPSLPARPRLSTWIAEYALEGRAHRLRVDADSPLVGRSLQDLDLRASSGVNVLAIERIGRFTRTLEQPTAASVLTAGDRLIIDIDPQVDMAHLTQRLGLAPRPMPGEYFSDLSQDIGMAEVMVPAHSRLVGRTVVQSRLRTATGLSVTGLRRGRTPLAQALLAEPLQIGDTLLVVGPWRAIRALKAEGSDLIVVQLPVEFDDTPSAADRAPHALAVLALVVLLMAGGIVPNVQAALIGCLLMGLFRCVDLPSAYRAVHWPSLILIVGMLPFSMALQRTGGIDLVAQALVAFAGDASPRVLLAALFAFTSVAGLFISNTATAVLMAPVALSIAAALGASPYPFMMTVALAASASFMTPVSSPVNMLVVGPGGYRFMDFVRVGVPLNLMTGVVAVLLVPWLLPL